MTCSACQSAIVLRPSAGKSAPKRVWMTWITLRTVPTSRRRAIITATASAR